MSPTLAARRARVARIRSTVTAVAVAVFLALFATIYIQMAAGKDPALGTTVDHRPGEHDVVTLRRTTPRRPRTTRRRRQSR